MVIERNMSVMQRFRDPLVFPSQHRFDPPYHPPYRNRSRPRLSWLDGTSWEMEVGGSRELPLIDAKPADDAERSSE
jgi:hypothetical protein